MNRKNKGKRRKSEGEGREGKWEKERSADYVFGAEKLVLISKYTPHIIDIISNYIYYFLFLFQTT